MSINSSLPDSSSPLAGGAAFGLLPLAISIGDPAGIGPEILIKSLIQRPEFITKCRIYGPRVLLLEQLERHATQTDPSQAQATLAHPTQAHPTHTHSRQALLALQQAFTSQLVEDVPLPASALATQIRVGEVDRLSGEIAFRSILAATQAVLQGRARALVTAPIHKEAMHLAGHLYPGHTELLAELAGGVPVRMMLANPELRTVLVTIHMSLRQALDAITESAIVETLKITDASLRRFGIGQQRAGRAPSLAVAGLNPHAGEGGLFGREEIDIIRPAIAKARSLGIHAEGPFAPDTIFMRARGLKQYDAVIALYHDQGLIPVKYLGVEQGVNVTLGLPFVRTSPDHGTAFDIAGQGCADASSMVSALLMADQLSRQ